MGTTPLGIEYPDSSDPVAELRAQFQTLAETVDAALSAVLPSAMTRLKLTGTQSIPNGVSPSQAVAWNTELVDELGAWSSGSTLNLPEGTYLASFTTQWGSMTTGNRGTEFQLAGAVIAANGRANFGTNDSWNADHLAHAFRVPAGGATFKALVLQNSGGAVDLQDSWNGTSLTVVRLAQ